jgi:MFS family permease
VAVLPDQIPVAQRGLVSGALGVCLPIASVSGTLLVQLFTGNLLAMFLVPCAIGGLFILLLVITLKDRRLAKADKPTWSLREFASTFYVNPRKSPDFAWAFVSRFLFMLAYAFSPHTTSVAQVVRPYAVTRGLQASEAAGSARRQQAPGRAAERHGWRPERLGSSHDQGLLRRRHRLDSAADPCCDRRSG